MARNVNLHFDNKTAKRSNANIKARAENTPIYQKQEFKPPKTLTKAEKKVWRDLVTIFQGEENCRVSDADIHLMELYCRAKVATDEADAALKEDPTPYVQYACGIDENGNTKYQLKANPNIKKRRDNATLCIKLFDQLGLSPLARARAGVAAANASKKAKDSLLNLMTRTDD